MTDAEHIERLAVGLRRAWSDGTCLQIEDLPGFSAVAGQADAVLDLVYHEVLVRQQHGQRPVVEEFVLRFPDYEPQLRRLFLVHQSVEEETSRVSFIHPEAAAADDPAPPSPHGAATISPGGPMDADPTLQLASAPPGYQLLEEVGRGGMALVYRARHQKLNRIVALKMLLAGAHATAETLARLEQEARAVAQLQHPAIVQIHEIGEHEGLPFLALEYLEGGTLRDWLAGRPLPPLEAATVAAQLAETMAYAHERGVVHRDLKPANVLLVWRPPDIDSPTTVRMSVADSATPQSFPQVRTKIGDFGLAHMTEAGSELTATGQILGTPSYMAPEQAAAVTEADPSQDIYSLGAILYELLTGRAPFRGPTVLDTLDQVRHEQPVPPRRLQSRIPKDIETICLKCLDKSPARRYPTAAALMADLHHFLQDEPIAARPISALEKGLRWIRRHPAVTATTLSVAVLSVVGLGAVLHEANRANESEFDLMIQRDEARRMGRLAIAERDAAEAARSAAEANLQRAIRAVESLSAVGEKLQSMPHQQQASQDIFRSAVAFYEDFLVREQSETENTLRFASALIRSAEVGGALGERTAAAEQIVRAIEILKVTPGGRIADVETGLTLAYAYQVRGTLMQSWQRPEAALAAFAMCEHTIGRVRQLSCTAAQRLSLDVLAANCAVSLAAMQRATGQSALALSKLATATQQLQRLADRDDVPASVGFDHAQSLVQYGSALRDDGQLVVANDVLERALAASRTLVAAQPLEPRRLSLCAFALYAWALTQKQTEGQDTAPPLAEADAILRRLVTDYPSVYEYRFRLAAVAAQRIALHLHRRDRRTAVRLWSQLCAHLDDSRARFPQDVALARWSHRWQHPYADFVRSADPRAADAHWQAAVRAGELLLQASADADDDHAALVVTQARLLASPESTPAQLSEGLLLLDALSTEESRADATRGLLLFEQGEFERAYDALEAARRQPGGFGLLEQWYLAMSHWHCGREDVARELVGRLTAIPARLSSDTARIERAARRCRELLTQHATAGDAP